MSKIIKDDFHILNEKGEKEITLKKICDIMGIEVPEKLVHMQDDVFSDVTTKNVKVTKGCCYIRMIWGTREGFRKGIEKGAAIILMSKEEYDAEGYGDTDYPVIPVEGIEEKTGKFFSYIKDLNDVKTIAVTGTCGKTTTMKFLGSIVPKAFNTYLNKGNANSHFAVVDHIMKELTPEHELYIQEVGAGSTDAVKKAASMLTVDAFILLNVFGHHLEGYGSKENILNDKASFIHYMDDNGAAIVNYDDEMLNKYDFKHKVISFGIETELDVDYRGCNINQNGPDLELDVVSSQGTVHISVNILGTHNAYNVLAAFALCKWLEISDEVIIEGFREYKSLGFRQNFRHVGGYDLLLDCYNCNEESLKADIKTLRDIEAKDGSKKIAVISAENRLGADADEISYALGQSLDLTGIDKVIVVGNDDADPTTTKEMCYSRPLYRGIKDSGFDNVVCVTETIDLEKELAASIETGDIILFKGLYNLDFTVAIDNLFGTAISMNNDYYIKSASELKHSLYRGRCFDAFNRVDILGTRGVMLPWANIPDDINGVPVHRIAGKLFRNNNMLRKVSFGASLKHIGKFAFENCVNLSKLTIPGNVKLIEEGAFRGCRKLKSLTLEEGVMHIEKNAFIVSYEPTQYKGGYITKQLKKF